MISLHNVRSAFLCSHDTYLLCLIISVWLHLLVCTSYQLLAVGLLRLLLRQQAHGQTAASVC